jgi:hypothetical protein
MIYVTGDTHRKIDNRFSEKPLTKLTEKDYLIILGDFGGIWYENDEINNLFLSYFEKQKYTTLFIDGNHENHKKLNDFPVEIWNGGKIHKIKNNIFHLMRGQIFNIDGYKIFTFGGAYSIDKHMRTEFIDWWKEEEGNYEEMNEAFDNLEKENNQVDFILTHAGPANKLKNFFNYFGMKFTSSSTEKFLDEINNKVKFQHWFCGHYHENVNLGWFSKEKDDDKITILYNKIININEDSN